MANEKGVMLKEKLVKKIDRVYKLFEDCVDFRIEAGTGLRLEMRVISGMLDSEPALMVLCKHLPELVPLLLQSFADRQSHSQVCCQSHHGRVCGLISPASPGWQQHWYIVLFKC